MTAPKGVALYTDPNKKPMPKRMKYLLWFLGILFIIAFIYAQFIKMYFLDRYDKMYTAKENIEIHSARDPESQIVGNLKLWKKVMVYRSEKSGWAELDKPVHGFVLISDLSTVNQMNEERIKRGLSPKRMTF